MFLFYFLCFMFYVVFHFSFVLCSCSVCNLACTEAAQCTTKQSHPLFRLININRVESVNYYKIIIKTVMKWCALSFRTVRPTITILLQSFSVVNVLSLSHTHTLHISFVFFFLFYYSNLYQRYMFARFISASHHVTCLLFLRIPFSQIENCDGSNFKSYAVGCQYANFIRQNELRIVKFQVKTIEHVYTSV